jgi:hypothetical protein
LNVRTGVRRCTALRALGGRRQQLPGLVFRTVMSRRSIVALLIVSSFSLTSGQDQVTVTLQGLQQQWQQRL